MKKNKFLKLASGLLMLVLITCCAVSGTFAKYVTTGSATDTARVAKWGIELAVTGNGAAFSQTEGTDPNFTVKSTSQKVVAPGTKGDLFSFDLKGTPEVAFEVVIDFTLTLENWTDGTAPYCPIVFTIGAETYGLNGMKDSAGNVVVNGYATTTELINAISAIVKSAQNTYVAGATVNSVVAISWEWAFEGNDDTKDTILGNATTAPSIGFSLEIEVNQLNNF